VFGVRYEGLRELAQALRIVNTELYAALLAGLNKAGRIVQSQASSDFSEWGGGRPGVGKAVAGFRTLVRPNSSTMAIVSVGQTLRRSSELGLRRSNWGSLQMTEGLIPARDSKLPEVVTAIDGSVTELLRSRGF
jgi:hypothetical protein